MPSTTAADRFRQGVERRDVDAMAAALAPQVRLNSPTLAAPIEGRERARVVFGILEELLEDFEYTHVLTGAPAGHHSEITATYALVFRARLGTETLEGVDVLDVDDHDQIVVFTVFLRPLAGLQALAAAVAARLAPPPAEGEGEGEGEGEER